MFDGSVANSLDRRRDGTCRALMHFFNQHASQRLVSFPIFGDIIQVPGIKVIGLLAELMNSSLSYIPSFLWHCNTFGDANFFFVLEINFRQASHKLIPNFWG